MEQEGIYAKKAATTRTRTLTSEDFIEVELVISNDLLFSREELKDYRNRHDMISKRGLMTACAHQTPDAAKEETEYTKQSKSMTWTNAPFSTNRMLKGEVRH